MKHLRFWLLVALCAWATSGAWAQIDKGDAAFEDLRYQDAIGYYEKALGKKNDPAAAGRLADSYRLTSNTIGAEKWYVVAIAGGNATPELRQHYARMLLANGKTAEARTQAQQLIDLNPNDLKAQNIAKACDNRDLLLRQGDRYVVAPTNFNSEGADYCPSFVGDDLIFTSDRGSDDDRSDWTGRNFTSLYRVDAAGNNPQALRGEVNGKYNDGAATLTDDGQWMYFTRNNYAGDKRRRSQNDVVNLIVARARLQGDQWKYEEFFPHNSPEFNTTHPAISGDGTVLVFASNRPGGQGGMDLWVSRQEGSTWSQPINLGPEINTPDNEIFPWLAPDGALIFASNGHPGLGGLDVFVALASGEGFASPQNVGAPINSVKDDFGCISRDGMQSGYFSSNVTSQYDTEDIFSFKRKPTPLPATPAAPPVAYRMNGLVVDKYTQIPLPGVAMTLENVATGQTATTTTADNGRFEFSLAANTEYRVRGLKNGIATTEKIETTVGRAANPIIFTQLEHNDPRFTLRGTAIDRKTQKPVENVEVKLLNTASAAEATAMTDANGKFFFQLAQNSDYTITGQKAGIFTSVKSASTMGLDRSTDLYVQLTLNVDIIEIGQEINLENIYFDLNKADIRPDAAKILDNLAEFLVRYPGIEIELTSHTDARNTHEYNQTLSQRRAESTMRYLVEKGIPATRLQAQGYGETQLTNRCADGVTCTEAEHQKNRRTAFKVLKF
jgi:outer membrane protein OmpA-like peptidoglycan-associated protein